MVKQCKVMGTSGLSDEELETMIDDGKNPFATSLFDQERIAKEKLLDIQLRHGEFMNVCLQFSCLFTF